VVVVRVLLAALNSPKGDLDGNLARHLELLTEAGAGDCEVAVFPEFSLTGYDHTAAIAIDDEHVRALAAATGDVAAVFGIAERDGDDVHITQVVAAAGEVVGSYRKRHLQDEDAYTPGTHDNSVFDLAGTNVGVVICAEGGVDWTWDDIAAAGARIAFFCSAPGLHGRRTDEASWRAGFDWWEGCGLGDARKQATRLGLWVAMATQAGVTADEDFPGIAALVDPNGDVVARLPDWRAGTLIVDID
jgi:predicted amidohydrolase